VAIVERWHVVAGAVFPLAVAVAVALSGTTPLLAQDTPPPAPGATGEEPAKPSEPLPGGSYDAMPEDQKTVDPAVRERAIKRVWLLRFEHGRPTRVTLGREPSLENFWVLPFTLTNEDDVPHGDERPIAETWGLTNPPGVSEADAAARRDFAAGRIFIDVYAESEKSVRFEDVAQPLVKEKARRLLGVRPEEPFWSQEELTSGLSVIKPGETVRCVAIFKGFSREMDRLKIIVRGLTNDVRVFKADEEARTLEKSKKAAEELPPSLPPHERKIIERALVLRYYRPGDEYYRTLDAFEFEGREWVSLEQVAKSDLD
jgi:hypothetical protein